MDRNPGFRRFRSSRAETRSCPAVPEPKSLPVRWRRADRSPAFRRAGPGPKSVSRLSGSSSPKALGSGGRFRSLPLSHSLRASPQLPPGGGFVSRPAFRFHPTRRPKAEGPASARAVAGKALLRCRKIVSATSGSCHESRGAPRGFILWIMRITCITPPPRARAKIGVRSGPNRPGAPPPAPPTAALAPGARPA